MLRILDDCQGENTPGPQHHGNLPIVLSLPNCRSTLQGTENSPGPQQPELIIYYPQVLTQDLPIASICCWANSLYPRDDIC